jgi:hypothetical protein
MKYSLRFVWYVLRIAIVAVSAFAILAAIFFIAMDSANVYVIVSDGMKTKATSVLMPSGGADLAKYFSAGYLSKNPSVDRTQYANFVITDFTYDLSVESLWCNPWGNTATVTVVESIPRIKTAATPDLAEEEEKAADKPPQWPRARYKIKCIRENDVWRIDAIELAESLKPEPTASPEPSTYITASPAPTSTASPSPAPGATASPDASATASPASQ